MVDLKVINNPDHYLLGREIEPIEVIESWALRHHLACVVKYISRCGRKHDALKDLLKAEWYLNRELQLLRTGYSKCRWFMTNKEEISLISILQDWKLPHRLEVVLSLLKPTLVRHIKEANLTLALQHLKEEIESYKGRGG